jgi:hypothetical protein
MKTRLLLSSARLARCRGLTLAETLVAFGIGSLVLATVASLTLYGSRSSIAIVNYTDLDAKSRYALDVISREVRQATGVVAMSTNSPKSLTMTNANQGTTIVLSYNPTTRQLVLSRTGQADLTALTECDRWDFSLYQRTPIMTPTNVLFYPSTNSTGALDLSLCKLIDMSWKCSRQILTQKVNTESVQAAQIVLRNKP